MFGLLIYKADEQLYNQGLFKNILFLFTVHVFTPDVSGAILILTESFHPTLTAQKLPQSKKFFALKIWQKLEYMGERIWLGSVLQLWKLCWSRILTFSTRNPNRHCCRWILLIYHCSWDCFCLLLQTKNGGSGKVSWGRLPTDKEWAQ